MICRSPPSTNMDTGLKDDLLILRRVIPYVSYLCLMPILAPGPFIPLWPDQNKLLVHYLRFHPIYAFILQSHCCYGYFSYSEYKYELL